MVVPANVWYISGLIASAMAVYGKVNEAQARSVKRIVEGSKEGSNQITQGDAEDASEQTPEEKRNAVAQTVLDGFEKTRQRH